MSIKLLLTSAGLSTDSIKAELMRFAAVSPEKLTVAFVATAGDVEMDRGYQDSERAEIRELGFSIVECDLKESSCREILAKADIIWISGGNTFYLLHWVRESGCEELIKELVKAGKPYVGVSAGSIIAGVSIVSASWKGVDDPRVVNLDSLDAMSLFDGLIFPHYLDKWAFIIEKEKKALSNKLYCLKDQEAISVDGEIVTVL